ncbi:MAG TPA: hypothetical protein P5550_07640 [Bacteroidales bacterium]|nr:hypothetical protein [Bacteroidales bacterium]HRZ75976.1 hypothetical protein [Bacteroidales bacterium]
MKEKKKIACEDCVMRLRAEQHPDTFWSRVWRWHTRWCPGWKAYQAHLRSQNP